MNYLNMPELVQAVSHHEQFQHEIKGKRIRKELTNLEEYKSQHITFKRYFISNAGLSFFIEMKYEHRIFEFEIFLDFDYPFNRPKIFYIHDSSPYAFCQDLLDTILDNDNGNWGPSMLLSTIFDRMPKIAECIFKQSQELKLSYQVADIFPEDLLTRHKIQIFQVQEYEWKYMIKSTFERKIGLSKQTFLKFTKDGNDLKLHTAIKIKDIKQANASISHGKYKLDISCNSQTLKTKLYFGGKEEDIENILYFMNPIQVTERKLGKAEKETYQKEEVQEMIQQYSELIEYYSLRDQEKTKKYVALVQELIKKNYEQENGPKLEKMEEDIKT